METLSKVPSFRTWVIFSSSQLDLITSLTVGAVEMMRTLPLQKVSFKLSDMTLMIRSFENIRGIEFFNCDMKLQSIDDLKSNTKPVC